MAEPIVGEQLRSYVERIERLEEEKARQRGGNDAGRADTGGGQHSQKRGGLMQSFLDGRVQVHGRAFVRGADMSGDILSDFARYEREHEQRWRELSTPMLSQVLCEARRRWWTLKHGRWPRTEREIVSQQCGKILAELRSRKLKPQRTGAA